MDHINGKTAPGMQSAGSGRRLGLMLAGFLSPRKSLWSPGRRPLPEYQAHGESVMTDDNDDTIEAATLAVIIGVSVTAAWIGFLLWAAREVFA